MQTNEKHSYVSLDIKNIFRCIVLDKFSCFNAVRTFQSFDLHTQQILISRWPYYLEMFDVTGFVQEEEIKYSLFVPSACFISTKFAATARLQLFFESTKKPDSKLALACSATSSAPVKRPIKTHVQINLNRKKQTLTPIELLWMEERKNVYNSNRHIIAQLFKYYGDFF